MPGSSDRPAPGFSDLVEDGFDLINPDVLAERAAEPKVDALLKAANSWRSFIRQGDNMLSAAQELVDLAQRIQNEPIAERKKAHAVSIPRVAKKVETVSNSAYKDFAAGRQALYEFAKSVNIPTRRRGGAKKPPTNLGRMTDQQLGSSLLTQLHMMSRTLPHMLELGATASRKMREAAKSLAQGPSPEELNAEGLVSAGLDFRDQVSKSIFAGIQGIMRRVYAVKARAEEAAQFESEMSDDIAAPVIGANQPVSEAAKTKMPKLAWERDKEIDEG
jgi:hypothetical protein